MPPLKFASEQAKAIVLQHRAAVLAIAEALRIHRTLNSAQIDNVISVREPVKLKLGAVVCDAGGLLKPYTQEFLQRSGALQQATHGVDGLFGLWGRVR